MSNNKFKVLIIEDEANICSFIQTLLETNGYQTFVAPSCELGQSMFGSCNPDLIILDLGLPDRDGVELIRYVRQKYLTPIIVLSARTTEQDKIEALDLGANDYITKPFNPLELVARVKTQLRRYTRYNPREGTVQEVTEYDFRGLQISKATHKCVLFGEELALTPLEFSILWYLCEHRGNVVSSEELFEHVWGEAFMDSNNTVMSHIARLREKMHEPSRKPKFIKTVWGVGYTIE